MNAVEPTVQALLANSGVSELVGIRVEPFVAPQKGALPDIVVHQMTNMDEQLLSGAGQYPNARVRIECRARTGTEALALGDAVIAALRDNSGSFGGRTVKSFLQEETDESDHDPEFNTFSRFIDFSVRYS